MEIITVQKRDPKVKVKQLRRAGFVPGSVFGGVLKDSVSIQIDEPTARKLFRLKREGSKLQLNLDGQIMTVQIKEKTKDTLTNELLHLSFEGLKTDQKVNSVVHIMLKNGDKVAGTLERMLMEIPYASLPADMIDTITVDLEGIPVGTVLTVGDIAEFQNEKIELQVDLDSIVLRIQDKKRLTAQMPE